MSCQQMKFWQSLRLIQRASGQGPIVAGGLYQKLRLAAQSFDRNAVNTPAFATVRAAAKAGLAET